MDASIKMFLQQILYIYYPILCHKCQANIKAWNNLGSEVNKIIPIYTTKLNLNTQETSI